MARFTPQRNETLAWFYDQAGTMLGFTLNDVPYFYVRNLQGDVVSVIDIDGNVVAWYTYCAWGNILEYGGELAHTNPITYRGYYKDWATGLYYLQSRYYCPALRRFISADIYMDTADGILGTNMYAYCHNDPINYYDPHGTSRHLIPVKLYVSDFEAQRGNPRIDFWTELCIQDWARREAINRLTGDPNSSILWTQIVSGVNPIPDENGVRQPYLVTRGAASFTNFLGQRWGVEFYTGRASCLFNYWVDRRGESSAGVVRRFIAGQVISRLPGGSRITSAIDVLGGVSDFISGLIFDALERYGSGRDIVLFIPIRLFRID